MGSFNFFLETYFFAFSKLSSRDTITKATLLESKDLYSFSIEGISARQGGHQLAHKFTNSFLPLKFFRLTGVPFTSSNSNSGSTAFTALAVLFSVLDCSILEKLSTLFAEFSPQAINATITNTVTIILIL